MPVQKPKKSKPSFEVGSLSVPDLERLQAKIDQELISRIQTVPIVAGELTINAGNRRANAITWIKEPRGVDPSLGDGWGICGDFLTENNRFNKSDTRTFSVYRKEGTLLVVYGRGGSHNNTSATYVVLRVKKRAKLEYQSRYQKISGKGIQLVTLKDKPEKILGLYPELSSVKPDWFEVYAILRSCGVGLTKVTTTKTPTGDV